MKITAISLLFLIFLSGCFKHETPQCSDIKVQQSVKTLYIQILQNSQTAKNPFLAGFTNNLPQSIQSLSLIRSVSYDDELKIRTCKANALFDNNQSINIEYTIQINEKNSDDFYIELDTEFLEEMMQQNIMQGIFNQ